MGLAHHPNVVTDGLVGCWDAGNRRSYPATGTTWTDVVGSSNGSFENSGGTSLAFDSAHGGSIVFDGTDDYVLATDFQDVSPVSGTNSYTFGIWVYFDSVEATTFLSQYISASNRWSLWVNASNDIYFADRGSGGNIQSAGHSYTFTAKRWYYLTVLKDGSTLKTYIDGSLVKSESFSPNNPARSAGLLFGTDTDNYDTLDGNIALVHAYNKALTNAEVLQNYNATKPRFASRIAKSGLVANWDAGDPKSYNGGTTTWTDTANGYAGALQNMEAGDFNLSNEGYFDFDGTNEYVNIGHVGFLSEGTIELWIRYDVAPGEESNRRPWGGNDYFEARHSSTGLGGAITWDISANNIHSVKNSWSTSVWYQQVWTWKYSSTTGSIYFDGELDVTGTITQDPSALASSNDMYLMRSSSTFAGNVQGKLAVFRVYNRALSAAEVRDNYQAAKGRFT